MRKTSIIILTYNNLKYTKQCIESIKKYTKNTDYEIIVIDNNSTDNTKKYLKENKDIKVIFNKENLGFPKGCNQGIEIASKENDILLLNNDTIVTTNWLENLKIALYSSDLIGATGSVCNQNENRQGIDFNYSNLEEMQKLAKENNISNPDRWEEKIFLIGFCILIKREVIEQLKKLDEDYSPGYIEDNDLSLRIIKLGYKLLLCHDSFIHHYLGTAFRKDLNSFYKTLYKNRDYFYSKWHFNTLSFDEIKSASFPLIESPKKVLELNCGIGVTILSLKYKYKNIEIEGVEENTYKREIAKNITSVYDKLEKAKNNYYDYILIGDILEQIKDINFFLKEIKNHLTKDGYLIGEFTNYSSIKTINKLLEEDCFYTLKNKLNFFSPKDIKQILKENAYKECNFFLWYEQLNSREQNILRLLNITNNSKYTYYTFKCKSNK